MSAENKAVFLSYASQDAEAARRICDALRTAGVEVWFDADGGLEHGDEWDAKIRRQVKECALFIAIVSANTQARQEGYFRIEWELAAQRAMGIASGVPFILPMVIDDTREPDALVPDRFRVVQWTRLPGGVVTPQVQQRLLKLWSHRTGVLAHQAQDAASSPPAAPDGHISPIKRHGWRTPVLVTFALTAVVALVAMLIVMRREPKPGASSSNAPAGETPQQRTQPTSEARKLADQAKVLIDDDPLRVRENFLAAERLCQRAIALDPSEVEAWATLARVSATLAVVYQDRSLRRLEGARSQAETAMRLAPDSIEAGFAMALYERLLGAGADTAKTRLERLLRRAPNDRRLLTERAVVAANQDDSAREQQIWVERADALPGGAPHALDGLAFTYFGRNEYASMERMLERSLARQPTSSAYELKLMLLVWGWGDLDAARAWLAQTPPSLLQEDRMAFLAFQVEHWSRRSDAAVAILRRVPRDFLEDSSLFVCKGYLVGESLFVAGKTRAAEIEWEAALQAVDQRISVEPNSGRLLRWKAKLLARLNRLAEAEKLFFAASELGEVGAPRTIVLRVAEQCALLGRKEEATTAAEERLVARGTRWPMMLNDLRFEPVYDGLRGEPRFAALIAKAEGWLGDLRRGVQPGASAPPQSDTNTTDVQRLATPAKSVAVLAFANLSEDKENEYFSDGISEELLNVLAKVPRLRVAARTSAFYFKGRNATAQEIGQKLGVAHLVDGNVRKAGARVRVAARLSKADTGEQLWSESYDRELKDIFALQDEIARDIARKLQVTLDVARRTKAVTPEAHRLVLEGRHFWNQRSFADLARAEKLFEKALEVDPEFAPAQAGLALLFATRGSYRTMDNDGDAAKDFARARAAAERALAADDTLTAPHAVLARISEATGRPWEAEQRYRSVLARSGGDALLHHYHSATLKQLGRLDLAIDEARRAVALDPLSASSLTRTAGVLYHARRAEEALAFSDRALALRERQTGMAIAERAVIQLALGRRGEALTSARAVANAGSRQGSDALAIWALWSAGEREEAARYAETVMATLPVDGYLRGFVLSALGRFDDALPFLQRTPPLLYSRLYWQEMWDPYRNDPRFQQLMVKLGCANEYKVARETLARMGREPGGTKATTARPEAKQ